MLFWDGSSALNCQASCVEGALVCSNERCLVSLYEYSVISRLKASAIYATPYTNVSTLSCAHVINPYPHTLCVYQILIYPNAYDLLYMSWK